MCHSSCHSLLISLHADNSFVLSHYKTELCKKPPRLCRQGYACPYYHNSKDRRRSPHKHKYRSEQQILYCIEKIGSIYSLSCYCKKICCFQGTQTDNFYTENVHTTTVHGDEKGQKHFLCYIPSALK